MEIGEFRYRIILKSKQNNVNDNGFNTETWTTVATVWSKVENLFGKEYFAAAAVHAENTVKFTIRFRKNLTPDMQIEFNNKDYDIVHIDNIKYGNRFIEIKAILRECE
jgi:SPP1 family predicted phage head-tail adaptor